MVAVLSARKCSVEVLELCNPEGHYAYLDAKSVRDGRGLATELQPLWRTSMKSGVLGVFVGPAQMRQEDLQGPDCAQATHFARAVASGTIGDTPSCPKDYWRPVDGCQKTIDVKWSRVLPASKRTSQPTRMDRTEVTVAEYQECVATGACKRLPVYPPDVRESGRLCTYGVKGKEQHPVNCISWSEAQTYCRAQGKRLPRSSEWSAVASVGSDAPYLWGATWPPPPGAGNFADERAKDRYPYWVTIDGYVDGFEGTAPVGIYGSDRSSTGILNLAGNVREWVADGRGDYRMVRGASFGEADRRALSWKRSIPYDRSIRSAHIGFRCVRDGSL